MDLNPIFQKELGALVEKSEPLSGGDINEVFLVNNEWVIKINDAHSYPKMLSKEANALQEMFDTQTIKVPEVIAKGEYEENQYLIMTKIEKGARDQNYWERMAAGLAELHQITNDRFGWKEENYIGYLKQKNDWYLNWNEFFIHCRMEPLVKSAYDDKKLRSEHLRCFDNLYSRLDEVFPKERPAMVHGDLWGGNLMDGLIDPAIYFGHREMDLAMTQMFGGFRSDFISLYHQFFPVEKGIDERIPVYNLYPNLTHLNMFGEGYLSSIEWVVKKF